jgi:hypothetical protein
MRSFWFRFGGCMRTLRGVWGSQGVASAASGGHPGGPLHRGTADEGRRAARGSPRRHDQNHQARSQGGTPTGFGGAAVHRAAAQPAVGGRFRAPRGVREPWRWWEATAGRLSQQACGSWRTVDRLGVGVVGGAVLDNDESSQYCQMGRARLARRTGIREEPAAKRSSRHNRRPETWRTWVGSHRAPDDPLGAVGELLGWVKSLVGEATVKVCGVVVAMVQGHSWVPIPSKGLRMNVGTVPALPDDRRRQRRIGSGGCMAR